MTREQAEFNVSISNIKKGDFYQLINSDKKYIIHNIEIQPNNENTSEYHVRVVANSIDGFNVMSEEYNLFKVNFVKLST